MTEQSRFQAFTPSDVDAHFIVDDQTIPVAVGRIRATVREVERLEQLVASADALLERANTILVDVAEAQHVDDGLFIDTHSYTPEEASAFCDAIEEWRKGNPHAWLEDVAAVLHPEQPPPEGAVKPQSFFDTFGSIRELRLQRDKARQERDKADARYKDLTSMLGVPGADLGTAMEQVEEIRTRLAFADNDATEIQNRKAEIEVIRGTWCNGARKEGQGGCGMCPVCCLEAREQRDEALTKVAQMERQTEREHHTTAAWFGLVKDLLYRKIEEFAGKERYIKQSSEATLPLHELHGKVADALEWVLDELRGIDGWDGTEDPLKTEAIQRILAGETAVTVMQPKPDPKKV